jgi:hypothetical protein
MERLIRFSKFVAEKRLLFFVSEKVSTWLFGSLASITTIRTKRSLATRFAERKKASYSVAIQLCNLLIAGYSAQASRNPCHHLVIFQRRPSVSRGNHAVRRKTGF